MKLDAFEIYIRSVTHRIDDREARKETAKELREHLTESYEEQISMGKLHDEAVKISLDNFGDARGIGADLDTIHTRRFKLWQVFIITAVVIIFISFVFGYFYANLGN
ncbi:MAG: permease prefix domain 1-containing protein [Eubacteriales bacterium]